MHIFGNYNRQDRIAYQRYLNQEIRVASNLRNQRKNSKQTNQQKNILQIWYQDYAILRHKLQNTTILEISNIQTQDIRLQKQPKIYLLRAKLSLEALFAQTNSKYIKMQSLQKSIQSLWLSIYTKTIREKKN